MYRQPGFAARADTVVRLNVNEWWFMWMGADFPPKPAIKRAEGYWLAGLLLAAFLVRWAPAFYPHFWFDEIYTIALTQKSFGEILRITAADMHPPLYYDWVKIMAMIGSRLGGPFVTLTWLRLASVAPGMVTCLLGWWVARRHWGLGAALWTLAAFAVAPALTYYSMDLRSYSTQHALLLGALAGFLEATARRPGARWPGMAVFGGCALAVFYTHSLSTIHLGVFGLIFLALLARDRAARRELAWRGAALTGILTLCCAPWLRLMFSQTALLNEERWLGWAQWSHLRATLFWYMPLGPWSVKLEEQFWPWLLMPVVALALLLLGVNAWRTRKLPLATEGAPPGATLGQDRLLLLAATMATAPILLTFTLSHLGIAKVFLGNRYNLIPAPFIVLTLVGLLLRIGGARRRACALSLLLALWAGCTGLLIRQRLVEFDILAPVARVDPGILQPENRVAWNNPMALPWLGKCNGPQRIGSAEDYLEGRARLGEHETLYLLTHLALDTDYSGLLHPSSHLLREIMKRRGITDHYVRVKEGAWDGVWRLSAADTSALAADLKAARARIEARRHAFAGGQVLLADEEFFYATHGWGALAYGPELLPERWTEGPHPNLSWPGPPRAGQYRLRLLLRRPHPFPTKEVTVRYRLPGQKAWSEQRCGPGKVTIEGEVRVKTPGERLRLELQTPTWCPAECLDNPMDGRHLGVVFEALELQPM